MEPKLKPLLLHAFPTSPNPTKIAIALELLRLPYDLKLWDFGNDQTRGVKSAVFVKSLSPNGRVPVLEDPNTGVVSWESGAIMNYLKRMYDTGDKVLGVQGRDVVTEQDRVDLEKWEYLLVTTVGPMTGQLVWFRYYNAEQNPDALQRYENQVYRCYDVLEKQLEQTKAISIVPGGITSVDCHWYPWTCQPEYAGLTLEKYPMMRKWIQNMACVEEVQAAYTRLKEAGEADGRVMLDADGKILTPDSTLVG